MTEILTESFCERCGTRYTFETAVPRRSRFGRVRVATKGLRNYVMQDESSFSEAMADARSDLERSATTHQLDAFHKTFNFCMTCRQYTCGNCWNGAEGRCLTCSPLPEVEPAAVVLLEAIAPEPPDVAEPVAAAEDETWPEADLGPDRLARAMGLAGAASTSDDAEAEPPGRVEQAIADAPQVRGMTPGQSLEDALADYEAQLAAQEEAAQQATRAADAPEPEPEVVASRGRGRGRGAARGRRGGRGAARARAGGRGAARARAGGRGAARARAGGRGAARARGRRGGRGRARARGRRGGRGEPEPEPEVVAQPEVVAEPEPEVVAEVVASPSPRSSRRSWPSPSPRSSRRSWRARARARGRRGRTTR